MKTQNRKKVDEGELQKQYRFKGDIHAPELCVRWTLPSEKLLLIKLTRVHHDSFPSMHSSM
jgi:hypothetical protein